MSNCLSPLPAFTTASGRISGDGAMMGWIHSTYFMYGSRSLALGFGTPTTNEAADLLREWPTDAAIPES